MLSFTVLMIEGLNSSQLAALSLEFDMILSTSTSATWDKLFPKYYVSYIQMVSVRHRNILASEATMLTKTVEPISNIISISYSDVLALKFEHTALCFHLFMTVLMICHHFLVLHLCSFSKY